MMDVEKDLDLDCLLEILKDEREITCHSYRQSEINMLMQVADSMGFTINTFTHILEGYKVADKMKIHGAGASTFSDWWAYKYEVNDAIPYNAAILNKMNIITAINSDDAEMGKRLNQEAAKSIKYGNISQEDAWKLITLNPAKLLHIDDNLGSLKKGKDADIVIVKFGEKYKQWNAAFDAGFAAALNKSIIVIHNDEHQHALKEVDAAACAVAKDQHQVVKILKYVLEGTLN